MNFKPAICPSCGGNLQVPDNLTTVKCMYCGVDVIVQNAIKLSGRVKEFTLAKQNYREVSDFDVPSIGSNNLWGLFAGNIVVLVVCVCCGIGTETGKIFAVILSISLIALFVFIITDSIKTRKEAKQKIIAENPHGILNDYSGQCPYCDSTVYTVATKPAFDCKFCNKRVIVRDSKFYSVDTPISGLSETT